jgi:hypothetical protein
MRTLVPLSAWKVKRSSISAPSPIVMGDPSSARIEVRRPTEAFAPSRTSPTIRANGSRTRLRPIVGRRPRLNFVRGARLTPWSSRAPSRR